MFFDTCLKKHHSVTLCITTCLIILLPSISHSTPAPLSRLKHGLMLAGQDQKNFYTPQNLLLLGSVVTAMGVIANTRLDGEFRDWYQRDVRRHSTDKVSYYLEQVGDYPYPHIFILGSVSLNLLPERIVNLPVLKPLSLFGSRSARIILTGAPPMGAFQRLLGSPRPTQGSSRWTPIKYATGMSGHTFLGAVPFLTVYSLTENKWLEITALALSPLVGISRINDNKHYLSQTIGGWTCAFIAARSLKNNTGKMKAAETTIITTPGFIGLSTTF